MQNFNFSFSKIKFPFAVNISLFLESLALSLKLTFTITIIYNYNIAVFSIISILVIFFWPMIGTSKLDPLIWYRYKQGIRKTLMDPKITQPHVESWHLTPLIHTWFTYSIWNMGEICDLKFHLIYLYMYMHHKFFYWNPSMRKRCHFYFIER